MLLFPFVFGRTEPFWAPGQWVIDRRHYTPYEAPTLQGIPDSLGENP